MFRSIRFKLFIFTCSVMIVVAAGILAGTTVRMYQEENRRFLRQTLETSQFLARMLAANTKHIRSTHLDLQLDDALMDSGLDMLYACFVDIADADYFLEMQAEGTLKENGFGPRVLLPSEEWFTRTQDGVTEVSGPLDPGNGRRLGYLKIAYSQRGLEHLIRETLWDNLVITFLGLVVGGIVSIFLSVSFTRPIHALAETTDAWCEGNWEAQAPEDRQDELGQLCQKLNHMATHLGQTMVSRQFTNRILQSLMEMIWVTDQQGVITKVNRRATLSLGYWKEELVGNHIDTILSTDEEWMEDTVREGRYLQKESLVFPKKDKPIPVMLTTSPILDNRQNYHGLVWVAVDLSAHEKAIVELEEARAAQGKAERKSRAKSEFVANLTHELRTPLNAVLGYSEMLEEEMDAEGLHDYIPDVQRIHNSGRHLLELINNLLDLSKLEAGKITLSLSQCTVVDIIQEALDNVQPLSERQGNEVNISVTNEISSLYTDGMKIKQVLINLLGNANKFTHDGEIFLEVYLKEDTPHNFVVFEVRDTGIGMRSDQVSKMFSAFVQADESTTREYGGTGLGLTISRKFCRMLGGDITADSELGKGSTFTFWIPIQSESEYLAAKKSSKSPQV